MAACIRDALQSVRKSINNLIDIETGNLKQDANIAEYNRLCDIELSLMHML